jgi:hypothetical protein
MNNDLRELIAKAVDERNDFIRSAALEEADNILAALDALIAKEKTDDQA